MENSVTHKPVLIVGLWVFCALGLSELGFARSVDWNENALQGSAIAQMFGPLLPDLVSPVQKASSVANTRNMDIAEAQFAYVAGVDVSYIGVRADQLNAQQIEKVEIDNAVLRLAYAQYLVSLLAAEVALGTDTPSVPAEDPNAASGTITVDHPEPILPVLKDLAPPIPHVRAQLATVADAENNDLFVSVPVEDLFPNPEQFVGAPMPASATSRPVTVVRPLSVANVQPARDVSLDPLVHVQVQGSWPRRLDQINARGNGNIFMQNWGRIAPQTARRLRRLPHGFLLVTTNK